jgi:putative transcriptional regulator
MSKLGQRMIVAAREALAWANGEETGAIAHEFPDVKAIRTRLGLSQSAFAKKFGLAVGNVRDWEQGRSVPDRSARVLLKVIATEPEAVVRALAA